MAASIATITTLGYGSFSTKALTITFGFGVGTGPAPPVVTVTPGGAADESRKKLNDRAVRLLLLMG